MARIDTKSNKNNNDDLSFEFPSSEKILIDKTSLSVELSRFKKAILDSFNEGSFLNLTITLFAVWLPLFTSDFKEILNFNPLMIKGGYVIFSAVVTFYFLYRFIWKPICLFFWGGKNINANPEKMAQIILDKCNKK
jgi:hypothetical protein